MKNSKFLQQESNIWSWFKIFTKQNHLWYHTKLIINDSLTVLWGKWHFAGAGFQEDNLLVQALQLLPHAQNQSFSSFIKLNKINCGPLVTTLPEMGFIFNESYERIIDVWTYSMHGSMQVLSLMSTFVHSFEQSLTINNIMFPLIKSEI